VEVEPDSPVGPLQEPEAVHEVALVLFQVRIEAWPALRLFGVADMETVGAGGGAGAGPKKLVTSRYRALEQAPLPFLPCPALV
jgi:hypothetical protein